jgi:hypothetical protein
MWGISVFNGIDHGYALGGMSFVVGNKKASHGVVGVSTTRYLLLVFFWVR